MSSVRKTPSLRNRRNVVLERSATVCREVPHLTGERGMRPVLDSKAFASRLIHSIDHNNAYKRSLALVISAYNESLVLEHTIRSAMAAGVDPRDIYVVDDHSDDSTPKIARSVIGDYNVLTVPRSGKGLAIHTVVQELGLTKRYNWIHIADADGEFDRRYFVELYSNLDGDYAAATGYVASLPGSYISKYRAYEYAMGMDIIRRFQSLAGVITIVPGPTSVFRSDVFEKLDFNANALCEDFDVTLQIHRQGLGDIQFIPTAIARTQDPGNFKDFLRQITRWNRGVLQMFFKHKIGSRLDKVDTYLIYQLMQNLLFFAMYMLWVPIATITSGSLLYLALAFLSDVIVVFGFCLFAQARTDRRDIIEAFPLIYVLRWVSLLVFMKAFVEVFILRKYRLAPGVWETVTRRSHA